MSDEERREVAAGLRSANLADLIYQGDMSLGGKERYPKQIRVGDLDRPRVYYPIDRDALLALADEMDAVKGFEPPYKPHTYPSRFVRVELLHGYAHRIREACGEVVE